MSKISRMFQDETVNVECEEDEKPKLSEEEIFDSYKKRLQSDLEKELSRI